MLRFLSGPANVLFEKSIKLPSDEQGHLFSFAGKLCAFKELNIYLKLLLICFLNLLC